MCHMHADCLLCLVCYAQSTTTKAHSASLHPVASLRQFILPVAVYDHNQQTLPQFLPALSVPPEKEQS